MRSLNDRGVAHRDAPGAVDVERGRGGVDEGRRGGGGARGAAPTPSTRGRVTRSREPDDIFTPPAFRPSNFLTQPVVRYPTTDKVAIENDGDIELNTGTVASAKVLTTADIFVDGSTEGLLAQLTSVTSRLAAAEAKLAGLVTCPPPGGVLSYDGTDFQCTCHAGYSGATCERPPSLTGCDGYYDVTTSKIHGAQAISGDSGNTAADPENDDIAAITDESRETYWSVKSSDETKVFLVFDMQAPSNVVAIAFRGVPTYDSVYQAIYNFQCDGRTTIGPSQFVIESGPSPDGPWTFVHTQSDTYPTWIPISLPEPARYIRISNIKANPFSNNVPGLSVVEFFEPNVGNRV